MADSVKDILRGFEPFSTLSNKGGDIDSKGHSSGGQGSSKTNNGDTLSIGSQNGNKAQVPLQSNQKGPIQKDRQTNNNAKDRGDRVRQLKERQQMERQQKLQELKDQAASAQRFREQQELNRRQRLDEMRQRDCDRRTQVEERRRLIETAELERRGAATRRAGDRDNRMELKRKQERSNVVFAFGSSTPRMQEPKESSYGYWGSRKATSSSNVNVNDVSTAIKRPNLAEITDLSRKRATSAHGLNRKLDDLRMSSSMYEVFNWNDKDVSCDSSRAPSGDDLMSQSMTATTPTAARRRTDLFPVLPAVRSSTTKGGGKHRSTGMTGSLSRLDQLSRVKHSRLTTLTPLHESPARPQSMKPARTISKSMSHLGPPQKKRQLSIGAATDGAGIPISQGSLDKSSSRSSLGLTHPRMTRSEILRLKMRGISGGSSQCTGIQSGVTTPNSSSRPNSALSQGSNGNQVTLRSKTARKPRPLSIAGSSFSSADKPRSNANAGSITSRESRPIERKSSVGNAPSTKLTRAKSAGGSDNNEMSTSKSSTRGAAHTPKRTPAQVKAESAARKAAEKSKITQKRQTPQATPLASPAVPSKLLLSQSDDKSSVETSETPENKDIAIGTVNQPIAEPEPILQPVEIKASEPLAEAFPQSEVPNEAVEPDQNKSDKQVTGYANEEEYKNALAEKRRLAREAKEKELEMEKQKEIEQAEKEKREEEDYLRLMEEQKKVEEDRLEKAIEEADRQREEDTKRKEEEEIQRIEAEKIEKIKQAEAAERMRKEEEERQARKNRVAAIMSRTRGKGAAKGDSKSPDELRVGDNLSMSDSFMANISSSMSDSMIVQAIESRQIEGETEIIINKMESAQQSNKSDVMLEQKTELVDVTSNTQHLNGRCLESSNADLIGSINGDVHNGTVTNGKSDNTLTDNQFDSFDPFRGPGNQTTNNDTQNFEQIIDLNQSKLCNEDVVNSNPPASIIAFEDNMNKKQTQDSHSTNVPDLLL